MASGQQLAALLNAGRGGAPAVGDAVIRAADNAVAKQTVEFMKSRAEKRIWHIYRAEKALAAAQAADMPFFEVASATVGDGNVITPRSLPEPQLMKIKCVTVSLENITSVATNEADLRNFQQGAYLNVSINDTVELNAWACRRLVPGYGITSNASATAGSHAVSGIPSAEAMYWLPVAMWIKGGEQFEVLMRFRSALAMTVATNRAVVEFHGPLWKRAFNQ